MKFKKVCYKKLFNEYNVDLNLQNEVNIFVGDLPDAATTLSTKILTDITDKPKFK